jgi:hypothetical protein
MGTLSMPGSPDRIVALKRRDTAELIAEELRRLDPDDIYAAAVRTGVGRLLERGDEPAAPAVPVVSGAVEAAVTAPRVTAKVPQDIAEAAAEAAAVAKAKPAQKTGARKAAAKKSTAATATSAKKSTATTAKKTSSRKKG